MQSKSPALVKITAVLLGIISLRAAIGAFVMVWRFGALWDAAFFLGVAACLLIVALGIYRGRVDTLSLGVAALATITARLMLDAVPILKYSVAEPVRWVPLGIACATGVTGLLLAATPSARRWFRRAES